MTDINKFIEVWQRSSSAIEVAEELGIKPGSASGRASIYRFQGFDLKDMTRGKGPGIYLSKLALAKKEIEQLLADGSSKDGLLSQLYQIVGSMADDLGVFDEPKMQRLLSEINEPTGQQFLPWPSFSADSRHEPKD